MWVMGEVGELGEEVVYDLKDFSESRRSIGSE